MKIGINARFLALPYTGVGKYTYHLIRGLATLDQDNEYFLFTPELAEIELPPHFKQIRVPEKDFASESLKKAHWEQKQVPAEMKKWKVDLAHFLYPANPTQKLDIPTIVTVHDVIPWRLAAYNKKLRSKLYHLNTKLALKKADYFITVSNFSKSEILSTLKVGEDKITVTPLASPLVEVQEVPDQLNLRRDFLLYVGGYDERKNVPLLMIAFQKFIANHYPVDLILVGAKNRKLERYLVDDFLEKVDNKFPLKPKGKIVFTENLSDHELAGLYKKAMALVHASNYEGFNLPLVEAMNYNLPMAVADIPVNREVAGDAAFFINPQDEDTFGLGLHQFLNQKSMHADLAQKAKARKKHFDWEKTAQKTLDIYRSFKKS